MLKISVITPTWNQADYIRMTIESVVHQTYENIEYIIIDNCSDDGTEAIVLEYMRQYDFISYIREKDNGQADAINKGFARITGDIVCWINSDDFYYSNTVFECVAEAFVNDENTDVIAGNGYYCDGNGNYTIPIHCAEHIRKWTITRWDYLLQPAVFWRRKQALFLDNKYRFVFDWKFFISLQVEHEIKLINQYFAVYRMYEKNKTGLDNAERKKEIYLLQKEIAVSKLNTTWCYLVYKLYLIAEGKSNGKIKTIVSKVNRALFHITNGRICSF